MYNLFINKNSKKKKITKNKMKIRLQINESALEEIVNPRKWRNKKIRIVTLKMMIIVLKMISFFGHVSRSSQHKMDPKKSSWDNMNPTAQAWQWEE